MKNLKEIPTDELKNKLEELKQKSKSHEEMGKYITSLSIGPLVAAIIFCANYFIPGLIVSGIIGSMFFTGWGLTASSINKDQKIKAIKQELLTRNDFEPYTQLAMQDVLKETHKPELVKKSIKTKVKDDNNNLSL